jgi:hypothetical protein
MQASLNNGVIIKTVDGILKAVVCVFCCHIAECS